MKTLSQYLDRRVPLNNPKQGASNFLPGPVNIAQEVRDVFAQTPVSHRSEKFVRDFQHAKTILCETVNARQVEILSGSGTLANDVIGAQLSLITGRGLVLSNGEFGDRLIDHATRFGLAFTTLKTQWGNAFELNIVEDELESNQYAWIWAVHCETSTGMINDMDKLKEICDRRSIHLCLDCISSIGILPVDLRGVYLASAVSGKGLGSFTGLSMVFYNHALRPSHRLPRYLDLGLYADKQGIPFTISSNLVYSLIKALETHAVEISGLRSDVSDSIRDKLRKWGFKVFSPEARISPAVITVELPAELNSAEVGREFEEAGFSLSYRSEYLLRRNWLQICLMGQCAIESVAPLLEQFERVSEALLKSKEPLGRNFERRKVDPANHPFIEAADEVKVNTGWHTSSFQVNVL